MGQAPPRTPVVLFHSAYGNTERIARAIAAVLGERRAVLAATLADIHPTDLHTRPWLVLGAPTHFRSIPHVVTSYLDGIPPDGLAEVPVAVFDTRYRAPQWLSGSAARGLARRLRRMGAHLAAPPESFFVTDREGPLFDGEEGRARAWARRLSEVLERR